MKHKYGYFIMIVASLFSFLFVQVGTAEFNEISQKIPTGRIVSMIEPTYKYHTPIPQTFLNNKVELKKVKITNEISVMKKIGSDSKKILDVITPCCDKKNSNGNTIICYSAKNIGCDSCNKIC